MSVLDKIMAADSDRLRKVDVKLPGGVVQVVCKIHPISEFENIKSAFDSADNDKICAVYCDNFFDPETNEKFFTVESLQKLTVAALKSFAKAFINANTGADIDEKN